jgi:hypothetical protein
MLRRTIMDEYEKYERECKKIREENQIILKRFKTWLQESGLSDKTIRKHLENVQFYINEFLLYEDAVKAKDGAHQIGFYLGYWFIKKAMWSSTAQIKASATSLKKFYTFMREQGKINREDLDFMKERIKKEMPEWIATMRRYDDPSIDDMNEIWGF